MITRRAALSGLVALPLLPSVTGERRPDHLSAMVQRNKSFGYPVEIHGVESKPAKTSDYYESQVDFVQIDGFADFG